MVKAILKSVPKFKRSRHGKQIYLMIVQIEFVPKVRTRVGGFEHRSLVHCMYCINTSDTGVSLTIASMNLPLMPISYHTSIL